MAQSLLVSVKFTYERQKTRSFDSSFFGVIYAIRYFILVLVNPFAFLFTRLLV